MDKPLKEFVESYTLWSEKREPLAIGGMLPARFESGEKEEFIASYVVEPWMANPGNFLHGGITCTMFDQTMGLLSIYNTGGKHTPTIDIKVSYCRPVPVGSRLFIRSRVLCVTRTTVQTMGEAWIEGHEGEIAAYASAAYHIISKESAGAVKFD